MGKCIHDRVCVDASSLMCLSWMRPAGGISIQTHLARCMSMMDQIDPFPEMVCSRLRSSVPSWSCYMIAHNTQVSCVISLQCLKDLFGTFQIFLRANFIFALVKLCDYQNLHKHTPTVFFFHITPLRVSKTKAMPQHHNYQWQFIQNTRFLQTFMEFLNS